MTERLRDAIAEVLQAVEEGDLRDATCSFRHPVPRFVTPAVRKKLDRLYAALADEPGPSRGELLEVDQPFKFNLHHDMTAKQAREQGLILRPNIPDHARLDMQELPDPPGVDERGPMITVRPRRYRLSWHWNLETARRAGLC